ncbi:MAG: mechanosensitive ion channel [Bacteroidaceae bacterium]|nr:mechanosensitive ion channel [Bacteroidaceae bacterium]
MLHTLQAIAPDAAAIAAADSVARTRLENAAQELASGNVRWEQVMSQLIDWGLDAGKHILMAAILYMVGHYIIRLLNYLLSRFLERRKVEVSVRTFAESLVGIVLQVLLIVSVVGALGVNTTSFAALLASFGVAVGMALSGNLQNLAGGIVILFLKPYKVGDWLEAQGTAGTVIAIQIFHTILQTPDGRQVFVPNGAMSSGTITNYNKYPTRRLDWTVSVEYGQDVERVRRVLMDLMAADARILTVPAPVVYLQELADSSVNILARAWCNNADYWDVLFAMNENIYTRFNAEGIGFPFPQLTIHTTQP